MVNFFLFVIGLIVLVAVFRLQSGLFCVVQRVLPKLVHMLFLVFLSSVAHAETVVTGAITGVTHWQLAGSPYVLNGSVTLEAGAELSVDPGVTIYMGAGSAFTVVSGKLTVQGTAAQPVNVLSDKVRLGQTPAPGDWGQWVLSSGTQSGSSLNYLNIQHGRGLVVNGSAPVFSHVDIRNHLGAALTLDLAASPTGEGNSASGNQINAIVVPAGDITGTVRWGIKGIPYYLAEGTLGVGSPPVITAISPNTLQQGETATLTLSGSRLSGATQLLITNNAGVQGQITSGSSASQTTLSLTAAPDAPVGALVLSMLTDAGKINLVDAIDVIPVQAVLTSLLPASVDAGSGPTSVTIAGNSFAADTVLVLTVNNPATLGLGEYVMLDTLVVNASTLQATIPASAIASAGSVYLTAVTESQQIWNGSGGVSNSLQFTVNPPPQPIYQTSCNAILQAGLSSGDGVYEIQPVGATQPFNVYCDMTIDGGGWMRVAYGSYNVSYFDVRWTVAGADDVTTLQTLTAGQFRVGPVYDRVTAFSDMMIHQLTDKANWVALNSLNVSQSLYSLLHASKATVGGYTMLIPIPTNSSTVHHGGTYNFGNPEGALVLNSCYGGGQSPSADECGKIGPKFSGVNGVVQNWHAIGGSWDNYDMYNSGRINYYIGEVKPSFVLYIR